MTPQKLVRLPADYHAKLLKMSEEQGRKMVQVLKMLIDAELERLKKISI